MYKMDGIIEMDTKIVILMILPRDVQSKRDMFLGMPNVNIFACGKNRLNSML